MKVRITQTIGSSGLSIYHEDWKPEIPERLIHDWDEPIDITLGVGHVLTIERGTCTIEVIEP